MADFDLKDDCDEPLPYISTVKGGNDDGDRIIICVRLDEDPGLNSIVIWNVFEKCSGMKNNYEISQYRVFDPYFIA